MIIGITGRRCAGKDTVLESLMQAGFEHISLADILKEEVKRHGGAKATKENISKVYDDLKQKQGEGVLGKRAFELVEEKENNFVISAITRPEEVNALRKHGHFFLVEVAAPLNIRFKRMKKKSAVKFSTFKDSDKKDKLLMVTMKMADAVLVNDGTERQLAGKIKKMIAGLAKKAAKRHVYVRPTWDEYFMGIVDATAKRATCDRGRTAVVIVKDRMILTTGYVGSPVGIPHCDEIGHQMKKLIHEDGHESQHCVRTIHAEVNAIALAARKGIAIDGATLYCKLEPCATCAKMLINSGIKRVVCRKRYHAAQETRELFKMAGLVLECLTDELEVYKNQ